MTNNSSMNRISISNVICLWALYHTGANHIHCTVVNTLSLTVQFHLCPKSPVISISPFSAESGQHSNRKVPCFTNKVLEWYKHEFQIHKSLDDKIRTTVQLITYTVPQNCLSNFHNSLFPWPVDFLCEGRHLGKIRLGANVTDQKKVLLSFVLPL